MYAVDGRCVVVQNFPPLVITKSDVYGTNCPLTR